MEKRNRNATIAWLVVSFAVFVVMIGLGITMRLAQGLRIEIPPATFYALMTMHGLGMAGALFAGALSIIWYIVSRTCKVSLGVSWISWWLFLIGAVALLYATLVGGFGPGWYALYPLPFVNAAWPSWATGLAIISLLIMGVAWLLYQLDILRAMAAQYGAKRLLAWEYIAGRTPAEPLPAVILIASMCAIAGTLGTLSGAATLVLYFLKWISPATNLDALLLKNTMFMFGHVIVNVCIYCGLCAVYHLMPKYSKRPWGVNRVTAIAWNATLLFVLFAYFHHLYMDFAQNKTLHIIGQITSYGSAVPATAVSLFGIASQVYKSGIKWSFTPASFVLGGMGWAIGGVAAVVDSTIMVNSYFHNTLWVPAHFHTYFLVGYVFMFFGFLHDFFNSKAERFAVTSFVGMILGGYGFLSMFYLGGYFGVPRRYAAYTAIQAGDIANKGALFASLGALFATIFLISAIAFAISLFAGRTPADEKAVTAA